MMSMGYTTGSEYWKDADSAGTVTALRTAAHHILYVLANSNAMDIRTGTPIWVLTFWGVDGVIVLLLAVWEILTIRNYKRKKEEEK